MKNLIGTPAGRRLAEELRKEMHQLQKETGYQFHNRGQKGKNRVIRYWF
jgi:hypothetical protein